MMTDDANQAATALPDEGLFPIRTVSAVTGVNPVTLRAWERRYKLIEPKRTPKGHRLYTRDQIDEIRRVVELLERGISISQVKPLLAREEEAGVLQDLPLPQGPADTWKPQLEQALEYIADYDDTALDGLYDEALSLYPEDTVIDKLALSALAAVENRGKTDNAGHTQKRFLDAYLRNRWGARLHHLKKGNAGPRLVAACFPEEQDENSLLLFALAVAGVGYRMVYLGADVPFEELPDVVDRTGAEAVVLSATKRPRGKVLTEQLPDLISRLQAPVFVGGGLTYSHENKITASGASSVGALSSIAEVKRAIRIIDRFLTP